MRPFRLLAVVGVGLGALVAVLMLARSRSPLVRELLPPADYFEPLATQRFQLEAGERIALSFRPEHRGRYQVCIRLGDKETWSGELESTGVELALKISEPGKVATILEPLRLQRFSDGDGRGYIAGRFRVPEDVGLRRDALLELEVSRRYSAGRSAGDAFVLEVAKASDL